MSFFRLKQVFFFVLLLFLDSHAIKTTFCIEIRCIDNEDYSYKYIDLYSFSSTETCSQWYQWARKSIATFRDCSATAAMHTDLIQQTMSIIINQLVSGRNSTSRTNRPKNKSLRKFLLESVFVKMKSAVKDSFRRIKCHMLLKTD